ncbi:MAG: hypothetical protein R3E62_08270 [Pseudomonadales bacterium]
METVVMIKGSRKTQLAMLGVAFLFVLSGIVLIVCEMYKTIEPVYLFGKLNLAVVLVVIGVSSLFWPLDRRGKEKTQSLLGARKAKARRIVCQTQRFQRKSMHF